MPEHIGQTIKRLRESRKLSKARLAREAGFSDAYLVQIEKGDRTPSESVLRSLAKALRVPPQALLIPAGVYSEENQRLAAEMAARQQERIEAERGGPLTQDELDRLLAMQLEHMHGWDEPPTEADHLDYLRQSEPLRLSPEDFWQWNDAQAWAPEHWNTLTERDRKLVQELINRLVELAG